MKRFIAIVVTLMLTTVMFAQYHQRVVPGSVTSTATSYTITRPTPYTYVSRPVVVTETASPTIVDKFGQKVPIEIYDEYRKATACQASGAVFITFGVIGVVTGALSYYMGTGHNLGGMQLGGNNSDIHKKAGIGLMAVGGTLLVVGVPLSAWGNHAKKDFNLYYANGKRIYR